MGVTGIFHGLQPIALDLSPCEVAMSLSSEPDLIFLDSVGNFPQHYHSPISLIASGATSCLKGQIDHWQPLQQALAPSPKGLLPPLLMGWIDYAGEFTMGNFNHYLLFDHESSQWYQRGSLVDKMKATALDSPCIGSFQSNFSQLEYEQRVEQIKQYIAAGDIYQVNLTQRFTAPVTGDSLFPVYLSLRHSNPAPLGAYLKLDHKEILSSSPETFLHLRGREIETRPIKGTRPRYSNQKRDRDSAEALMESAKEQAELTMITDLLRNDIGQVCEYGSISVPELNQIEHLEHVHHLASKVCGTLHHDCSHIEALAACFPGGSITGAPKIRSMQIIDQLETVPRGIYTGAIGYFGLNGTSQFNIAIRTLIRDQNELHYHVGAGIVADSNPSDEYLETIEKAKGVRKAVSPFTQSHPPKNSSV